jgi:integrase
LEFKKVPAFDIRYTSTPKEIFRDMPESVFSILMSVVIHKHKDILMLIALGAFAGMRPSECCNVRRNDSKLGAGIRFQIVNGEVEDIIIDLTKEINLRSDLISVGKIKKERTQRVYPAFNKVFYDCYQIYMNFIEGNKYESDFGALTTNKQGKAITYDNYYVKFKKVIKDLIPELLDSNDPEAVNYGYLLQERNITPHILRHWFSVKLTLLGEDISGLMYWRGDKSPESALIYLQNKGDLVKQYAKVNNEIFDYSMWKVSKLKND